MSPSSSTRHRGQSIAGWAPTAARSAYDEEELEFWTNREVSLIENLLGGQLKSIQLRDRDCLTDEARDAFQKKSKRPMVVLR